MYIGVHEMENREEKANTLRRKPNEGWKGDGFSVPPSPPTDILNFIVVEERCEIKMAAAGGMRTLPSPLSPLDGAYLQILIGRAEGVADHSRSR
jgi:hypothetical protein